MEMWSKWWKSFGGKEEQTRAEHDEALKTSEGEDEKSIGCNCLQKQGGHHHHHDVDEGEKPLKKRKKEIASQNADAVDSDGVKHLVILQYGLHGAPTDLESMMEMFVRDCPNVICYCKKKQSFTAAHDGIEVCAKRLYDEIEEVVAEYKLPQGTKLSFVGHSLGGLIVRYVAGMMLEQGRLEYFNLQYMITFATPHCGARRSPRSYLMYPLAKIYCGYIIGRTGAQLLVEDSDGTNKEPLLKMMADERSIFMAALKLFKRRILYSNVANDVPVPYCTAAILPKNPYKDKHLHYLANYPHVIDSERTLPSEVKDQSVTNEMNPGDLSLVSPQIKREFVSNTTTVRSISSGVSESSLADSFPSDSPRFSRHLSVLSSFSTTELYVRDDRREVLLEILSGLQTLDWERHDVHFYGPMAHELIVAKRHPILPGLDVVNHMIDTYFIQAQAQAQTTRLTTL